MRKGLRMSKGFISIKPKIPGPESRYIAAKKEPYISMLVRTFISVLIAEDQVFFGLGHEGCR